VRYRGSANGAGDLLPPHISRWMSGEMVFEAVGKGCAMIDMSDVPTGVQSIGAG
jgi:hypothetical protein